MDTHTLMHTQLNTSSPIVQRVLRLREQRALSSAITPASSSEKSSPITPRSAQGYEVQMWQKSDFSTTSELDPGHRCSS